MLHRQEIVGMATIRLIQTQKRHGQTLGLLLRYVYNALSKLFISHSSQYTLIITNQTMSPDGTPRWMLVVNGTYPGPTITASELFPVWPPFSSAMSAYLFIDWGDTLEITVVNQIITDG